MLVQHLYDFVLFEYISGCFFVHVLLQWLTTGPLKFTQMHHINYTNRKTTIALIFFVKLCIVIYSSNSKFSWNFTVIICRRCWRFEIRWDTVRSVFSVLFFFLLFFLGGLPKAPWGLQTFSYFLSTDYISSNSSKQLSVLWISKHRVIFLREPVHCAGMRGWFIVISVKRSLFSFLGSRHINRNVCLVLRSLHNRYVFLFPSRQKMAFGGTSWDAIDAAYVDSHVSLVWHSKWKPVGLCKKNGKEREWVLKRYTMIFTVGLQLLGSNDLHDTL